MSVKRSNVILLFASTLLGASAQLIFKVSISNGALALLALGISLYLVSSLIYFYVISRAHLSWAYGVGGLSYIFAVAFAAIFIEQVPLIRWVGVLIITAGVILVAIS